MQNAPFSISCPTMIRFGRGSHTELPAHLPMGPLALVRGQSGTAAGPVAQLLQDSGHSVVQVICPKEPSIDSVNAALQSLSGQQISAVVACGGGSVIDTGKALAFGLAHGIALADNPGAIDPALLAQPHGLPCIALPTTAGTGAEVTGNAVLQTLGAKLSLRGRALYPSLALVDPDLLPGAPAQVRLHAALDAVVQSIESYTSAAATPFSDGLMAPNIATGLSALRAITDTPRPQDWDRIAWVSLSSGLALSNSGLGAAHGLASVVGGRFEAPHGALCGLFLAPVLRLNLSKTAIGSALHGKIDSCVETIAKTFAPDPIKDELSGLDAWLQKQKLPRLRHFGVSDNHISALAEQAVTASSSQKNPVLFNQEDFRQVLQACL